MRFDPWQFNALRSFDGIAIEGMTDYFIVPVPPQDAPPRQLLDWAAVYAMYKTTDPSEFMSNDGLGDLHDRTVASYLSTYYPPYQVERMIRSKREIDG